jgi:hypothetical protein
MRGKRPEEVAALGDDGLAGGLAAEGAIVEGVVLHGIWGEGEYFNKILE